MNDSLQNLISSDRDAEGLAAKHMSEMGFANVEIRPLDDERAVDIGALGGSALVRHHSLPTGLSAVQQIRGAGGINSHTMIYALSGFTPSALQFAEEHEVALFKYSIDGTIEAQSTSAERLMEFGWLSIGPELDTTARELLDSAVRDYVQSVIDTATAMGVFVEDAVSELEEENGGFDDEARTHAQLTSRDLKLVLALLVPMNELQQWDPAILIRDAQRAEAILHKVAERWNIDYSDVELDASVKRILGE